MKKLLNTLYVTTQGSYLAKEGETVTVKIGQEVRLRVPVHTIGGIVCFGNVSCSPFLMGFCGQNGVGISFLSEYGKFLARVHGPVSGNVLLRRAQYRLADDQEYSGQMAKSFVTGKIANCRTILQRALRDHSEKMNDDALSQGVSTLSSSLKSLELNQSLDSIRGLEGDAAHTYFGVFDNLIVAQKESFTFQ